MSSIDNSPSLMIHRSRRLQHRFDNRGIDRTQLEQAARDVWDLRLHDFKQFDSLDLRFRPVNPAMLEPSTDELDAILFAGWLSCRRPLYRGQLFDDQPTCYCLEALVQLLSLLDVPFQAVWSQERQLWHVAPQGEDLADDAD